MVVDTSALVAVVFGEPDAQRFGEALRSAPPGTLSMSAVSAVEATIVVEGRHGPDAVRDLESVIDAVAIEIAPVDAHQVALAQSAWRRFGKGRHPAGLNLGDVFSYALAMTRGEPLLFKGDDFSRTDVRAALV